jgi:hypothetical protein
MKFEEDLYPRDEPNAGGIAVRIVIMIAILTFLAWCAATMQARAEDVCATETQEARLTEVIAPGDHVWIFTGAGLETFLQGLRETGLMIGIPITDKVYVTFDHYYSVFFLNGGCIVQHYPKVPPVMLERILPK